MDEGIDRFHELVKWVENDRNAHVAEEEELQKMWYKEWTEKTTKKPKRKREEVEPGAGKVEEFEFGFERRSKK